MEDLKLIFFAMAGCPYYLRLILSYQLKAQSYEQAIHFFKNETNVNQEVLINYKNAAIGMPIEMAVGQ